MQTIRKGMALAGLAVVVFGTGSFAGCAAMSSSGDSGSSSAAFSGEFPAAKVRAEFGVKQSGSVITAHSDTPAEAMVLTAGSAEPGDTTGIFEYDGEKRTGNGWVTIKVKSLRTGIALRDQHLQSEQWMDAARHPDITFRADAIRPLGGDQYEVKGTWTMKGVPRLFVSNATITYLPAEQADKLGMSYGLEPANGRAWVRFQTMFPIKLSEYGIDAALGMGHVANAWDVSVDLLARVVPAS